MNAFRNPKCKAAIDSWPAACGIKSDEIGGEIGRLQLQLLANGPRRRSTPLCIVQAKALKWQNIEINVKFRS